MFFSVWLVYMQVSIFHYVFLSVKSWNFVCLFLYNLFVCLFICSRNLILNLVCFQLVDLKFYYWLCPSCFLYHYILFASMFMMVSPTILTMPFKFLIMSRMFLNVTLTFPMVSLKFLIVYMTRVCLEMP